MTVCNAVMIFAELAAQKSRAQRVLLYPKMWDQDVEHDGLRALELERSMRLIRVAAVRYGVVLAPIEEMLDIGAGKRSRDLSYSRTCLRLKTLQEIQMQPSRYRDYYP